MEYTYVKNISKFVFRQSLALLGCLRVIDDNHNAHEKYDQNEDNDILEEIS